MHLCVVLLAPTVLDQLQAVPSTFRPMRTTTVVHTMRSIAPPFPKIQRFSILNNRNATTPPGLRPVPRQGGLSTNGVQWTAVVESPMSKGNVQVEAQRA